MERVPTHTYVTMINDREYDYFRDFIMVDIMLSVNVSTLATITKTSSYNIYLLITARKSDLHSYYFSMKKNTLQIFLFFRSVYCQVTMVVGLLICSVCFLGSLVVIIPLTAARMSTKNRGEGNDPNMPPFELRKPPWRDPPPPYQE